MQAQQNNKHNTLKQMVQTLVPIPVAMAAFIPCFQLFNWKSESQLGSGLSQFNLRNALTAGAKTAPILGVAVGVQLVVQSPIERFTKEHLGIQNQYCSAIMSGAAVGMASVYPLAALNAATAR